MCPENLNEDTSGREAAESRLKTLKKKNPSANYTLIQGRKTGKWHVVRHTTGGMHMVEDFETDSFEEYLQETISVDHSAYMRSHMKKPRGSGNWFVGIGTHNIDFKKHKEGEHYVRHNGTVSDAVKKAKEVAKKHGHGVVHVLP